MDYKKLREELSHKERTIDDLISYIGTRTNNSVPNYSLLLGAGASFSSGIRTGGNLVDVWRQEIYKKLSGKSDYDVKVAKEFLITNHSNWYSLSNEYSSLFEYKFDLPNQRRRFVEQEVDNKLPSIGYSYLVSLTKNRYFDTVYTTNFDDLLSEAFYQFSQTRPIVCAHDSSLNSISISSSRPKIIKLHGDYLFDDIKSTLRETESLESNTKEKLIEFSKEYGLIVIGYSGNDRSIMDVISHLLKTEEYLKNGIYWCIREDDHINPELTKLLWKERVYFVKIDGFDEVLAEIHHTLAKELSLEDNFTNSKKELIISSFTKDEFKLSEKSELIKYDISQLRKHKDSMDISNLIRELNEKEFNDDDDKTFSEDDFKVFLKIDRLLKEKNYTQAKDMLKVHLENVENLKSKEIYIRKLIGINKLQGSESESIKLCDDLIEMDPFSVRNFIFKAENLSNLTERCDLLKDNKNKFEKNYIFQNYIASIGFDELKYTKGSPVFNIDTLESFVDKSLSLNPSLDNQAWKIKLDIIDEKFSDVIDKKSKSLKSEAINNFVEKARVINDSNLKYLEITLRDSYLEKDYENAMKAIDHLKVCYSQSSDNKKIKIFDLICEKFTSLYDYKNNNNYMKDWTTFIESDFFKSYDKKNKPISLLICHSEYLLKVDRDVEKCLIKLSECCVHPNGYEYARSIISHLTSISSDFEMMDIFVNKISEKVSELTLNMIKSDIAVEKGLHNEALDYIDLAYKNGIPFEDYLIRKSYILLRYEKYHQVKNLLDSNNSKVKSSAGRDLLLINRELAAKNLGETLNEVAIRNIISHGYSEHLIIAAECLFGKKVQAMRLISASISKNYSDLFSFNKWPVIPNDYLPPINNQVSLESTDTQSIQSIN
jgi:NAD-dependent SIR2 family protein deacetylase